jgi:hypothetical protein
MALAAGTNNGVSIIQSQLVERLTTACLLLTLLLTRYAAYGRRRLGLMLTLILASRVLARQARGCRGRSIDVVGIGIDLSIYQFINFDVRYSTVSVDDAVAAWIDRLGSKYWALMKTLGK